MVTASKASSAVAKTFLEQTFGHLRVEHPDATIRGTAVGGEVEVNDFDGGKTLRIHVQWCVTRRGWVDMTFSLGGLVRRHVYAESLVVANEELRSAVEVAYPSLEVAVWGPRLRADFDLALAEKVLGKEKAQEAKKFIEEHVVVGKTANEGYVINAAGEILVGVKMWQLYRPSQTYPDMVRRCVEGLLAVCPRQPASVVVKWDVPGECIMAEAYWCGRLALQMCMMARGTFCASLTATDVDAAGDTHDIFCGIYKPTPQEAMASLRADISGATDLARSIIGDAPWPFDEPAASRPTTFPLLSRSDVAGEV